MLIKYWMYCIFSVPVLWICFEFCVCYNWEFYAVVFQMYMLSSNSHTRLLWRKELLSFEDYNNSVHNFLLLTWLTQLPNGELQNQDQCTKITLITRVRTHTDTYVYVRNRQVKTQDKECSTIELRNIPDYKWDVLYIIRPIMKAVSPRIKSKSFDLTDIQVMRI